MRTNSLKIISFIILGLMNHTFAQKSANRSLGNLISYNHLNQSLLIETDYGKASLEIFDEGIVRIRIVKEEFTEKFSYAVIAKPEKVKVNVKDEGDNLVLETESLKVHISKTPVRFTIFSADGTLLNADDRQFGTSWIGTEVTTYKTLQQSERFLGLGEKTGNLDRIGSAYENWNTDNPRYGPQDDPLYVTIPFYIGVVNEKSYGIFFDNTHRSRFNFGASNDRFSSFSADDGEMDYYFIHDRDIKGILSLYGNLTGRLNLPPIWSLGYQQCRWSYFPDTEVLSVVNEFRSRKIPLDVIYLDIHYMDAYKIFTWHPERFKNPKTLLNKLSEAGVHTTVIVDPGIKVEKGYSAYEDGLSKGVFIKYPDGKPYTAQVWPGWCHFPDFTMPEARDWWGNNFKDIVNVGIDGFWNDMNEIASWGGGYTPHLVDFSWEGDGAVYRQAKNVYGMQMARATYEGTSKFMNGKRPFVLTRAGYAGLQRYTALWTGDNHATDEHMMLGVRLINSLGLSGVAFSGVDVGGFSKDATPALFARWISIGAFSPFFRSHTHYDTRRAEPWSFGETVENISRNYIQFRYKLLPYIYSAFYESSTNGMPVSRSLAIEYTNDEKVYWFKYQNQYLFGPSILVAPVESTKEFVEVYLPKGDWYNLHTGKLNQGNSEIIVDCPISRLPVFIKAGSVIPMQKGIQSTGFPNGDTLFIHVFKGTDHSEFLYYEDDGNSYKYQNEDYYSRKMTFNPVLRELNLSSVNGSFSSKFKYLEFNFHGFSNLKVSRDKKDVKVEQSEVDLLNALENNDPLFIETMHGRLPVTKCTIENSRNQILLRLEEQ